MGAQLVRENTGDHAQVVVAAPDGQIHAAHVKPMTPAQQDSAKKRAKKVGRCRPGSTNRTRGGRRGHIPVPIFAFVQPSIYDLQRFASTKNHVRIEILYSFL